MRVCLITPEFPPMQGGVGDYTSHLIQALHPLGLNITVLTSARAFSQGEPMAGVYPVSDWGFGCWGEIAKHVDVFRPDIVHVQYQTAGYGMRVAINLLPLRLRISRRRPKLVTTFHDLKVPYLFPKAGKARRLPVALLGGWSDAVILTNHEDVAQIAETRRNGGGLRTRFRSQALHVIPIGSNIPVAPPVGYDRVHWREALGVKAGQTLLCYFGFLNRSKGIETLLAAFEILLSRGLKVKLLMAGGAFGDSDPTNVAYGKGIMESIERSNYHSLVLWTGFVDRAYISASLLASDICVLPFDEGASLRHGTLMAAIGHSLPIVTTTSAISEDEATIAQSGLPSLEGSVALVPPRQPKALAMAIERLVSSDDERNELRKKVEHLASAFEWNKLARDTLAVYRQAMGNEEMKR